MSDTQIENAAVNISVEPERKNGRVRHGITVYQGSHVIFADKIDLGSSGARGRFLNKLANRLEIARLPFNRTATESLLLEQILASRQSSETGRSTAASPPPAAVLDDLNIDVLGERDDQAIILWMRNTRKKWIIKSPDKWSPNEILQAIGESGADKLWFEQGHPPDGCYSAAMVRRAVALAAAETPRIAVDSLFGQGIWKVGDRYLIVNGAEAHTYDGNDFSRITHPRFEGKLIDFSAEDQWSHTIIERTTSMTVERARTALTTLETLLGNWNWTHPHDTHVQAALVPATFVQACWSWRPLNSLIGQTDSGKSTLLQELIVPIFGEWAIAADRSTEAGLRQAIRCNVAPVVIDEFDQYRHRQQVMELFRTASRGGRILRGTQNQSGVSFGVHHIPWFAAIETGDVWGQDRNRFIRAELRPATSRGQLHLPGRGELRELGENLAAAALWAIPHATGLADAIKSTRVEGVHGRLIECYAVPAAMHTVLNHGRNANVAQATELLLSMLADRDTLQVQGEPDQVQLLRDILATNIRVQISPTAGQGERSVAQLLNDFGFQRAGSSGGTHRDSLEAKGLRVLRSTGTRDAQTLELFVVPNWVRRELLGQTRWAGAEIDQILIRLPNSRRCQQRIAGQKPYGVAIPAQVVQQILGIDDGERFPGAVAVAGAGTRILPFGAAPRLHGFA